MLNRLVAVQVSDTTKADSSTTGDQIKKHTVLPITVHFFLIHKHGPINN